MLRAGSVADLLGVVPVMLGFHPEESLVAVKLEGARQRLVFSARVDLPPVDLVPEVAGQVDATLEAQGTTDALVIAYSADAERSDALVAAVTDRLRTRGVKVVEALRADGALYWSYTCEDPRCCPAEGSPYDAHSGPLLAQAVAAGTEVLASRDQLVQRLAPVPEIDAQLMTEACARQMDEVSRQAEDSALTCNVQCNGEVLLPAVVKMKSIVATAVRDPGRVLSSEDAAFLSVWCSLIVVRDIAWNLMTRENAGAHFAMWSQVARLVVPPFEPAVLTLAGFAAWLHGDGASAWCALDRVQEADPDYSMAALLREALERAAHPDLWSPCPECDILATLFT